ncbi:MAG: hypothetical protein JWM91_5310 [Rhodospirillales bacterium]|nr:hypothetical protein [Rhodospirillales bacterium]
MSVPGRIGVILIIALALVDALILASGAKQAATAIETHALIEQTAMQPEPAAQETPGRPAAHKPLLSKALHEINLLMAWKADRLAGI